jgi:hypothetical protein
MQDRCNLCLRRRVEGSVYCKYHLQALTNIKAGFEKWRKALGISWEDYLKRIMALPETGVWVKEVTSSLLDYNEESASI